MTAGSEKILRALRALASEETVELTVRGESMRPAIQNGARLSFRRRAVYWPGDVVGFRCDRGRLLVHRLLGYLPTREGWRLLAQGDALSAPDRPITPAAVIGRVSGGDAAPEALRPPLSTRARAVARYAVLLGRRLFK